VYWDNALGGTASFKIQVTKICLTRLLKMWQVMPVRFFFHGNGYSKLQFMDYSDNCKLSNRVGRLYSWQLCRRLEIADPIPQSGDTVSNRVILLTASFNPGIFKRLKIQES
jgi:hypothetical protein